MIGSWETFVLISDKELDFLQSLRGKQWVLKSSRKILAGDDFRLENGPCLLLGDIRIPISYNLPFDTTKSPFRFPILLDGWRIDELYLFKPLIYYVAFGDVNVLAQLYLSIESLLRVGKFAGDIIVYTDRDHATICKEVPCVIPNNIRVVDIRAHDWVGYVAGKYCILDDQKAYDYQPVIYMDPDIIYNKNFQEFLIESAVSDRMGAPIEHASQLATAVSVGAELLQLDNEQPRFACGFNAGTLCIPNLPAHRQSLELIRRVIQNFTNIRGRGALGWVDQEAANYVSYKFAFVNTNYVSQCVRYGFENDAEELGALSGLVHFWPVARANRPSTMKTYLDLLLRHYEQAAQR